MTVPRRLGTISFALGMLLVFRATVFALNPALDISQYSHTAWKIRDGFTQGTIFAIAQTPDGYLWLGTQFGLFRFDGIRPVSLQPPAGQRLPSNYIRSLLVSRDGTLWIGTHEGLAAWKDGRLTQYPELAGQDILALLEDHEGTVWIGGAAAPSDGKLCAASRGAVECYGERGTFGQGVLSFHEDHNGILWAADLNGLWRWKPGPPKHYRVPAFIDAIEETEDGRPLLVTTEGLMSLTGEEITHRGIPASQKQVRAETALRSSDGSLWIGTLDHGLLHVHNGRTDWFAESDGLSGTEVFRLFEDREGSIWAATGGGLDRFRDFTIPAFGAKQGLAGRGGNISVLAARDGSIWLSSIGGAIRFQNGQPRIYRKGESGLPDDVKSLGEDSLGPIWVSTNRGPAYFDGNHFIPVSGVPNGELWAIAMDPHGGVWVSHQAEGLFHLEKGDRFERIPWSKLGRDDWVPVLAADPANGGVWLAFFRGGAAYLKNGEVRTSYSPEKLAPVMDLKPKSDGTVWAATASGLSRVANGGVTTLTRKNGLPCDAAQWSEEDDDHALWLQLECGLIRIAASELAVWVADPARQIQFTLFDISDGVRTFQTHVTYGPRVSKSRDGKLWFTVADGGVSLIDPRHLPFNKIPPPVHIEQITADRKTYAASTLNGQMRLPPLVRDLEVDYTALSFAVPERVRFRYKLEGYDRDWQDAGTRRQAFYTNLAPRNYRFRVIASNNSGVWNEAGASLDFSIAPAYYQTTWFRLSVVAAFLALLAGLYQLRLRQVARQFNIRLEERVNERTRIARDLHDTLLQSFQALLLRFHAVTYLLDRPEEARKTVETVVEQARQAITEGRDAVQGLRSSTVVANDLARTIGTFVEGLAADQTHGNSPEFHMHVEGKSRDLPPLVRDEVYRIACEALRNAFRHAGARRIEVDIHYDQRQFRFRVRDDGKGIDPQVLGAGGRTGHHGLPGMHERAKLAGGKLVVWSQLNSGVEIELTIPASFAYARSPSAGRSMAARKGTG